MTFSSKMRGKRKKDGRKKNLDSVSESADYLISCLHFVSRVFLDGVSVSGQPQTAFVSPFCRGNHKLHLFPLFVGATTNCICFPLLSGQPQTAFVSPFCRGNHKLHLFPPFVGATTNCICFPLFPPLASLRFASLGTHPVVEGHRACRNEGLVLCRLICACFVLFN